MTNLKFEIFLYNRNYCVTDYVITRIVTLKHNFSIFSFAAKKIYVTVSGETVEPPVSSTVSGIINHISRFFIYFSFLQCCRIHCPSFQKGFIFICPPISPHSLSTEMQRICPRRLPPDIEIRWEKKTVTAPKRKGRSDKNAVLLGKVKEIKIWGLSHDAT